MSLTAFADFSRATAKSHIHSHTLAVNGWIELSGFVWPDRVKIFDGGGGGKTGEALASRSRGGLLCSFQLYCQIFCEMCFELILDLREKQRTVTW